MQESDESMRTWHVFCVGDVLRVCHDSIESVIMYKLLMCNDLIHFYNLNPLISDDIISRLVDYSSGKSFSDL